MSLSQLFVVRCLCHNYELYNVSITTLCCKMSLSHLVIANCLFHYYVLYNVYVTTYCCKKSQLCALSSITILCFCMSLSQICAKKCLFHRLSKFFFVRFCRKKKKSPTESLMVLDNKLTFLIPSKQNTLGISRNCQQNLLSYKALFLTDPV